MRCAEGVVYEQIGEIRQFLAETGVVLLFLRSVADVLQQHHFAGSKRRSLLPHAVVHDGVRGCELHGSSQQFLQALRDRCQRKIVIRLALGTAEVAHQDNGCAFFQHVLNGGQRSPDAGVIRDGAFLHGYVEVAAADDPLSLQFHVSYSLFHR